MRGTVRQPDIPDKSRARAKMQVPNGCTLLILVAVAGVFFAILQGNFIDSVMLTATGLMDEPAGSDPTPVTFVVNEGDTATTVGERLEQAHLIRSALAFRLQARWRGIESQLEAGDYELNQTMTMAQILDLLQHGKRASPLVTIPEGWRAAQIADRLDQMGLVKRADFIAQLNPGLYSNHSYSFLDGLPPDASLEGFLFPESYQINNQMSANDIVQLMLKTFDSQAGPDLRSQAKAVGLSFYQALILASIIEREAQVPAERPVMASVFFNRLERNMPLQADATVQYAVTQVQPESVTQFGYWKAQLLRSDLAVDSPYNTYLNHGLPPGPICNPGLASIKAVLQPAHTDYLYFVAKPDGSHAFARTLEEHNQNVQKYQR